MLLAINMLLNTSNWFYNGNQAIVDVSCAFDLPTDILDGNYI